MTLPPLSVNAWLRWDVVRRLLPPDPRTVLEVGCGQGALGVRLAASGLDYLGVEPDPASYATAAQRLAAVGRGEVRHGTTALLAPGRQFHLVCAFEVLEHLEDDAGALGEWVQLVRPGGWLLLSVPAHARRFAAADAHVGHFRRYDPPALETLLRGAGLTDVTSVLYGMPLGYLLESGRNALARRSAAHAAVAAATPVSVPERTSGSGRWFQPGAAVMTPVLGVASAPFRLAQRASPRRGTGLVVRARKSA